MKDENEKKVKPAERLKKQKKLKRSLTKRIKKDFLNHANKTNAKFAFSAKTKNLLTIKMLTDLKNS